MRKNKPEIIKEKGESIFDGEPFEDNIQQESWDNIGDAAAYLMLMTLRLNDLEKFYEKDERYIDLVSLFNSYKEYFNRISKSDNPLNIKHSLMYCAEIKKIVEKFS